MRRDEDSIFDAVFDVLKETPYWIGPILAIVAFAVFRYLVPALMPAPKPGTFDIGAMFRPMMPLLSWLAGGAIIIVWFRAEAYKRRNSKLLNTRSSVASLGDISWSEFERLVSEGYRRQGYSTQVVGSSSGDGGVDIEMTRQGETILVQCKQWKAYKVGVTTIREMLGVIVSRRANRGIVVTSGKFTIEAQRFAQASSPPIELVDGPELFALIRSVQPQSRSQIVPQSGSSVTTEALPPCPKCGAEMVERIARKGPNAGSKFWGCPKYPNCRGRREINAA